MKQDVKTFYARDRRAWRRWLERNHTSSGGVWLVRYKKASGTPCVPYDESVEEALCFGWIDGQMKPVDDEHYLQYFAPRRPRGTWAASNKARVERLIREGLMTPAGMAAIEAAKRNGSWSALDHVDAMTMPEELTTSLARNKRAQKNWDGFSASSRRMFLYWIGSAKRPDTRAKRIAETVRLVAENIKQPGG